MFGWCKFDTGANPPPFDYVNENSLVRIMERRNNKSTPSQDEVRWDSILSKYGWGGHLDNLDAALLDVVESGVLDADQIEEVRSRNQNEARANGES